MKILKKVFSLFLTAIWVFYTFLLLLGRIESASEFRLILLMDIIFGIFFGLLLFLWLHSFVEPRLKRFSFMVYLFLPIISSLFFIVWHVSQVTIRGGNPYQLLLQR